MQESPEGVSSDHTNQPKDQQNDYYGNGHIFSNENVREIFVVGRTRRWPIGS